MSAGPLELSDDDFWFDPYRTELDTLHRLAEEEAFGLILDAPERVELAKRTSLPLMGIHAETLRDAMTHPPFERAGLLVAVRLDRNQAFVGFANRRLDPLPSPPPVDADPGEGGARASFRINMRTQLGIPWSPATYAVCVLQREVLSNQVTVELVARLDTYEDPAVQAFVTPRLRDPYPRPVWPPAVPREEDASNPQPVPCYEPLERTPPIPDDPGIALAIERVQVIEDDATGCVLYGSFRLPALSREIVRPCAQSAEELEALAAEQARIDALDAPPESVVGEPEPSDEGPDYLTDDEVEWPPEEDPEAVVDPVVLNLDRDARSGEWTFMDQYSFAPPRPEGPRESGHVWCDVGAEGATAVIPITIVATGVKLPDPHVVFLQVPSYDPIAGDAPVVTGQFAVDLLGFAGSESIRRQTCYVYAFSGRHRAGPAAVALLSPDML